MLQFEGGPLTRTVCGADVHAVLLGRSEGMLLAWASMREHPALACQPAMHRPHGL